MTDIESMPTAVYRLYDEADALLYIGMTNDPERRFEQHAKERRWWPRVARRTVQWFADRPTAGRAEVGAIQAEAPKHNGTHSPLRRPPGIYQGEDGVCEVSLSLARPKLTDLVNGVAEHGPAVALVSHGHRRALIVSMDFYERALAALDETRVLVAKPASDSD